MEGKKWTEYESDLLKRAYKCLTIKELEILFPDKTRDSINAKIRRLKSKRKIVGNKNRRVRIAALQQRRWSKQIAPGKFNVDPDSWRKG
jgi:hypothetical protein